MDRVRMKNADRELLEAVSAWWAGRLEEEPAIREAMEEIESLSGEHSDKVSSLLYVIIGKAADMTAEAALNRVL